VNYLCQLQANDTNKDKMRLDYICNALGGAPMYGLTITNNIKNKYIPQGKEIFKYQRFEYRGHEVKPKKVKYIEEQDEDADEEIPSSKGVVPEGVTVEVLDEGGNDDNGNNYAGTVKVTDEANANAN
jgi:hypothetical protein